MNEHRVSDSTTNARRKPEVVVVTGASADVIRQSGAGTLRYTIADTGEPNPPNGVRLLGAHREVSGGGANTWPQRQQKRAPAGFCIPQ